MDLKAALFEIKKDHDGGIGSGTERLGRIAIILSGVASLVATLLSFLSIWFQLKNYRKPLLQRYVVRILIMVPIYAISSWVSLISLTAAQFLDPIRDMYEAFTIYTFFQLLINFLGGERSLIIMMHGRAPREHVWPLNYVFPKCDISDPHTFLAIKRGILQYAWLKPPLALATIIMKATDTYQEGYVGLNSGYFWSGIIYNISVTISLYSLGIFWVCMSRDLTPFRPVPKFLCVKLIIFFSYWQGFFLSILVWLGVIHDVGYYTPDNIARAIQDVLICFELPGFAIAHWYAFSWRDYADATISAARMPVYYAWRDAFGVRDLIEDSKQSFTGKTYQYRLFDSSEGTMAHPESNARVARMMEGLRYERGGKAKYWVPQPTARTGLLSGPGPSNQDRVRPAAEAQQEQDRQGDYGAIEGEDMNLEDESLYRTAKALEFGDYNYPVITANRPYLNHRCSSSTYQSAPITTSTNQALLRSSPAKKGKATKTKKPRGSHSSSDPDSDNAPLLKHVDSSDSAASSSSTPRPEQQKKVAPEPAKTKVQPQNPRDGCIDLIVEDHEAEETARVRARKEGGPGWNEAEPKRFIRQWPPERAGEEIHQGFEPTESEQRSTSSSPKFEIGEDDDDDKSAEVRKGGNEDEIRKREGVPRNQERDNLAKSVLDDNEEEEEEEEDKDKIGQGFRGHIEEDSYSPWREDDDEDDMHKGHHQGYQAAGIYGSLNERSVWGG